MICGYVAKNSKGSKGLIINRVDQKRLADTLSHYLQYKPFVYNTQFGLYVFLDKNDCNTLLEDEVKKYLQLHSKETHHFNPCHGNHGFFKSEIKSILNDDGASSFAWKNFISSFLSQLQPFKGEAKSVHALFKGFVKILKDNGSKAQLDYLKHKMNLLRSRISVSVFLDLDVE